MTARLAYISTYPPRRCGIAEFTRDLRSAAGFGGAVVALDRSNGAESEAWPSHVVGTIADQDREAYRRAARRINESSVDVVSLQHEFGIYGGPDGALVRDLLETLEVPIVATLHTVLRDPTEGQRSIVRDLGRHAEALVVMSHAADDLLRSRYDIAGPVHVIPHGVPARWPETRDDVKYDLGIGDRPLVLSFGLVGPGKGFEHAIDAMAHVRTTLPDALYVILGATHPDLIAHAGEAYRDSLAARVRALGLDSAVRFENRFASEAELLRWLTACDAFITPYPNLDQIVSGTLAFALGAGRAVVSTPYAYAVEMLRDGRGLLVEPGSPSSMGRALTAVLADQGLQAALEASALAAGERMRWPRVGGLYADLFEEVSGRRARTGTASTADRNGAAPIRA